MSRGLIVRWNYANDNNNNGSIAACSPDVVGQFFAFTIDRISDAGLVGLLRASPHLSKEPDCAEGPGPSWVDFVPNGAFATNVSRVFP
jgi:hypothetical protein